MEEDEEEVVVVIAAVEVVVGVGDQTDHLLVQVEADDHGLHKPIEKYDLLINFDINLDRLFNNNKYMMPISHSVSPLPIFNILLANVYDYYILHIRTLVKFHVIL